jgi:hypothetical protein
MGRHERQLCEWFALCRNTAEGVRPHPVLGEVPICKRCDKIAKGEED